MTCPPPTGHRVSNIFLTLPPRDDSIELSRFFVFGEMVKEGEGEKIIFNSMIITLILSFTCLIDSSFNFTGIGLERVKRGRGCQGCDLSGEDLTGADFTGANMKKVMGLEYATKCESIMPWGEENSGCK